MLTADEVLAVVRVHADRVHDAVRRLGCGPAEAIDVVESSALDLVRAAAADAVSDPVGWWFARARALGEAAAVVDDDLPVGGGVLGGDANQLRLAEALENRPERERAALLLRDSYDLPAASVGTTLGLDANAAMQAVGAARLAFLPSLLGGQEIRLPDHDVDLAGLARLAEGGQPAARDATTRRHVQSCERCADALDAMERARRLLSGLTVVALPEEAREALLARVESRVVASLPAAEPETDPEDEEWDDEPRRGWSLSLVLLGLVVAIGLGIGGGVIASRHGDGNGVAVAAAYAPVTAPPVIVIKVPALTPTPTVSPSPTPRTFVITPSPTPSPTATPTPTATSTTVVASPSDGQTVPLTFTVNPTSGPNDTVLTVSGTGWLPDATVTLTYTAPIGTGPGASTTAKTDAGGSFSTTLQAHDPLAATGPHTVSATDGTNTQSTTFDAT